MFDIYMFMKIVFYMKSRGLWIVIPDRVYYERFFCFFESVGHMRTFILPIFYPFLTILTYP